MQGAIIERIVTGIYWLSWEVLLVGRLQYRIYKSLSRNRIYCDVVVVSEECYHKYKDVVGTIAYYAHLEGKQVE